VELKVLTIGPHTLSTNLTGIVTLTKANPIQLHQPPKPADVHRIDIHSPTGRL
jgi:hypothetical protein